MKTSEKENREISRSRLRAINKLGYLMTASALFFANTDKSIGDLVWHGNNNMLVYEDEVKPGIESWVVVPGLGVQSGSGIASTLNNTLGHRSNLTYFNYSDNGAQIDEMSSDILELYNQTKAPVSFYAHSMGASITLKVLQKLNNQVPISNIVFDCSPFDVGDASNPATPIYSEVLPAYGGGFISKIGAETLNNTFLHENKNLSFYGQLKDSLRIAITGSSPRLFTDQLGILGDTDSSSYGNYISDTTRVIYVKPNNSSDDDTVNVDSSIEKYKQIVGDKLIVVNVKYGKHASPTQRPSEYNSALWPYIVGLQEEPHKQ